MTTEPEDAVVIVNNVTKNFRIPLEASSGIKQKLVNTIRGRKGYREFTPLNDISFTINKGDFFGIVGRNGSGKSTLLKTLAGIYTPNSGAVHINGTLVPFIELGVGFNPELTGKENIFLNGALLGFSRKEIEAMYDDIVDFAELHDFMEERLKNYSSGMQVRLAFSIAIRADGDILLLDEVLAVGDEAFQQKCFDYFGNLKKNKKTVILVTHDMGSIERFCNKAILIEKGHIKKTGTNIEVAQAYRELFSGDINLSIEKENTSGKEDIQENELAGALAKTHGIVFDSVVITQDEKKTNIIEAKKPFAIKITFKAGSDIGEGVVGVNFRNTQNIILFAGNTRVLDGPYLIHEGINEVTFTIEQNVYTKDSYEVNIAIGVGDEMTSRLVLQKIGARKFAIKGARYQLSSPVQPLTTVSVQ